MDTSATMDPLNDTPLPPELSFDDLLLDESPVKKSNSSNILDDPLDFDEDEKKGPPGDETLHTPGPKKAKPPPVPVALAVATTTAAAAETATSLASTRVATTATKYERPLMQQPTVTNAKTPASSTTTTTSASVASATVNSPKLTTATPPVLLNSKNVLPKTAAAATTNKIIKIAPKTLTSTRTTTTTTGTIPQGTTTNAATSVASLAGKAVKTSNGQIYYIQKKASVLPAVRLQQAGATTSTGTSAATTTATTAATVTAGAAAAAATTTAATAVTTNASGSKTVAIQVIRTADGSLMPVKGAAATTLAAAAAATGKKIISNVGGQVLIKTPLRTVTGIASAAAAAAAAGDATGKTVKLQRITTTSATADSNSGNIVPVTKTGGKIIVHSASGKQIVVSNQNLIKLSPKPTATQQTIGATTGAAGVNTSVTAGAASGSATGKMLQLTGKPLQYVRVLPNSKLSNNANAAATSATTTSTANPSATAVTTAAGTATAKPAIRILNPLPPQKFTVVRPSAATKLVLTQSPKKDGGVTFSPVTSKVQQKTIVTLPTQPRAVDDDKNSPTTTPISSSGSSSNNNNTSNPQQSLIRQNNNNNNNNSANTTYTSLIRKPKISEINSEIKRITSTATSAQEHPSRNSSRSGVGSTEIKRNASGNNVVVVSRSSNLPPLQPRSSLNSMVQGTLTNTYSNSNTNQQQPRKLYSVLKNSNASSTSSSSSLVNNFAANNIVERKSLLISVQEQALIAQQHHKSLQIKRQLQSSTSTSSASLLHSSNNNNNSNQAYANYSNNNASSSSTTSNSNKFIPMKIKEEPIDSNDMKPSLMDDGVLRRKHCNCSKSQCLKLYCDCFANGEFCQDCTCKDCFNNLQYEDERQRAIKNCLERNPSAFKPKITTSRDSGDMRLHNKGCNCKRSGCLKNYCECYEAKIPCSSNCKCIGCRNIEERPDLDMDPIDPKILATIANASGGASAQLGQKRSYDKANSKMGGAVGVSEKMLKEAAKACALNNNDFISGSGSSITGSNSTTTAGGIGGGGAVGGQPPEKQQCNFITQEVVDATIQCMLSQADECEKNGLPAYQTEKMVMEEMGRCLVEIIDFSIRNTDTSFSQE